MAKDSSKQILANIIQANEVLIEIARQDYSDKDLIDYFIEQSLNAQDAIDSAKKQMKELFSIDYDSKKAQTEIIKEGSEIVVMVDHMHGMKNGIAKIKSYSLPAMLSDITMSDGMKMNNHKWLTNNEVKLK